MPPKSRYEFEKLGKGAIEEAGKETQKKKREERIYIPFTYFYIKDLIRDFANHKYFPDSMLSVFALLSVAIAAPFYPLAILIPLLVVTFFLARMHPLAGLMALLFSTFPMYMYQTPLLAWLYAIFISAALFLGFKHYRTITLIYALISLPFSFLGYLLEVPVLILGILFVGLKRSFLVAMATILIVPIISGLTGIQSSAPIAFNLVSFRSSLGVSTALQQTTPSNPAPTLAQFPNAVNFAISSFFSFRVAGNIFNGFYLAALAEASGALFITLQIVVWFVVVLAMTRHVIKSRSGYKGTESSIYSIVILLSYLVLAYAAKIDLNITSLLSGFVITPLMLFILESSDIEIVKALDVMKRDFLGKFGDAFEELTSGTHETLDDIGDYKETKEELKESLLAPTEHREIAGAYNIKPAKGILLFGPPGTGKTFIMRALSNEIRARFFYVKTSSIVSPVLGEGVQMLSKIFDMVKKNKPAVLFFDEIDGIASRREVQTSDTARQLMSTLLSEMDGFQKTEGIMVVGSTNVPQLLDPSIMRPGRFDKIIYMPLPDRDGRLAIFKKYAKKYPFASDVSLGRLADMTQRFSGADIENVCTEAARQVAEVALTKSKILKIDTDDLTKVIKKTKPSTSLARIAEYERFKLDYERRMHEESSIENVKKISIEDVIGLNEAKKALYEAIVIPILHPKLVKQYDVKNVSGILLFGPPGTGKSTLMKAIINDVGEYRMLSISGADISKEGPDQAIAVIKETFDRAKENAPSIVFIDEIDSLIPDRERSDSINIQITAEFLREFDSVKETPGVILVGATNRPDAIDTAMIRPGRLDKLIFAGPPDKEARSLLFQLHLKNSQTEKIDFDRLASLTEGYTGADIENICREAKMGALESNLDSNALKKITTKDLEEIIKETRPSAGGTVVQRHLDFLSRYGRK